MNTYNNEFIVFVLRFVRVQCKLSKNVNLLRSSKSCNKSIEYAKYGFFTKLSVRQHQTFS